MSHISFSELKEWTVCPWKHKLNYIDKVRQFKGNEYTAFGTALHTICEKLVTLDSNGAKDDYNAKEDFQNQFLNNLKALKEGTPGFDFNINLVSSMRLQGDHLIQFILPGLKKSFGKFKLIQVEEKLYEIISDQEKQFKGFIDLVIFTPKDKKYHIIDWKTCSWGWDSRKRTEKMITYQLTLYKHFWCKKHNKSYDEVATHFALLKRTAKKNNVEIFKVSNGTKKINNALKLLNKSLYNINKKNSIKNRLSCYGRYGKCEYYKSQHCT
jgi:ATP-dependent exoDNAse (exonuclease V) beta subunit